MSNEIILGSSKLNGAIAELRIWNSFRSAGMMGYKMHSNIDAIDMKHISYYYPLNESEGTTIVERT